MYAEGTGSEVVAIKKTKIRKFDHLKHSLHYSILREIGQMQNLRGHENIINLWDCYYKDNSVYVVMDFMPMDLHHLIWSKDVALSPTAVKNIAHQLLTAVWHLHDQGLVHWDIKPGNMLFNPEGVMKLTDFGLARWIIYEDMKPLTRNVVTRFYRAPEVLYGAYHYD